MRGGWIAGLIELCVYLFGFTVTGTLVARDCASRGKHPDDALCIVACAFIWPLAALLFGGAWAIDALARLFEMDQP